MRLIVAILVPICCACGKITENEDISRLINEVIKLSPPFHLSHPTVTEVCRQDSRIYLESLKKSEHWALEMYDASAKISSGILNGNILQFGDFDQCLQAKNSRNSIQGKYCLTEVQPKVLDKNSAMEKLRKLIQAHDILTSEFEMSGHIAPRGSSIYWGLCVPSTCEAADVQAVFNQTLQDLAKDVGVEIRVRVDENMCYMKKSDNDNKLSKGSIFAMLGFGSIFILSVLSTIYDTDHGKRSPWLTAFSLKKNWNQLTVIKENSSDIKTAHGIRFFCVFFLLVAHKSEVMSFNRFINKSMMSVELGEPFSAFTRSSIIYTDTFLMLSAMLTVYSYLGKLSKGQKIQFVKEYVGRYIRIMAPLIALIVFTIFILPLLGTGPQWNSVVKHQSDLCSNYWWRNLLVIQNFFGFENICLTHTHYVAVDTQLFLATIFVVIFLWKYPKKCLQLMAAASVLVIFARFYIVYTKGLSDFIFFGISNDLLFKSVDYIYVKPHYRIHSCAIGIALGYILRNYKNFPLSRFQIVTGWVFSILMLYYSVMGSAVMSQLGYVLNPLHPALFAAFAPVGWCLSVAWMIFVAENGHKNFLIKLLEWKGFVVVTRIAYCIYLGQYTVFYYNIGTRRHAEHFGLFKTIFDLNEFFWILLVALTLTLFIELPFSNIKGILLNPKLPVKVEQNGKKHG